MTDPSAPAVRSGVAERDGRAPPRAPAATAPAIPLAERSRARRALESWLAPALAPGAYLVAGQPGLQGAVVPPSPPAVWAAAGRGPPALLRSGLPGLPRLLRGAGPV